MAINEVDESDAGGFSGGEASDFTTDDGHDEPTEVGSETTVRVGEYSWADFLDEHGYDSEASTLESAVPEHEEQLALDTDDVLSKIHTPEEIQSTVSAAKDAATTLNELVENRTVSVQEELDEDEFFSNPDGTTTVTNRYDLEKAVPDTKKRYFREVERYWVNKPYAYVVIFHSEKENEKKYYVIEPYLNEIETEVTDFLSGKLRTAIKYSEQGVKENTSEDGRRSVIESETRRLLKRYDLFDKSATASGSGLLSSFKSALDSDSDDETDDEDSQTSELRGISARPEPVILAEDPDTLTEYQVEKLLYLLKRDFIGYERIDGIKHDINVEDISCDGYNSPVFVYHSEYEQIISNIYHGEDELDDFVVKLAQRSGKGISKRLPQVDATLPDGSRAQLTLGKEVSDHGTNYTIRQFKDVPFTPIDLINWNTFSLDEMAFLWLAIENHKSLIFAGGTASGKTTSLNAVSIFIPSSAKIVSIEDTREVELPQRNWIASVTRPSFTDDEQGDVDEFDLLEAALRQRPDYIVMGEIRGEEGRTLFQVMSTGHTTYTTFHADSVDEVLKRFTTDPINVSKTMFTALNLVSIQTQTRVQGKKVRRNKSLTEINHYEAEHDEINVQDVYQWQAETDEFLKMGDSNTLEEIRFDRGWSVDKLETELFKREVILAYLIKNELNTYAEVAATVQAFINDPETILTLIANGQLEESLEDLREMESVLIDVDPEKEELVPRPDPTTETYNLSMNILDRAEESLFEEYRGEVPSGLASALGDIDSEEPIEVDGDDSPFDFGTEGGVDSWQIDDSDPVTSDADSNQQMWEPSEAGFETAEAGEGGIDIDGQPQAEQSDLDAEPSIAEQSAESLEDDLQEPAGTDSIEADTEELNALFDDMGGTLETIEEPSPDNTSEHTSAFSEDELDAMFDPGSDDDSSVDFETALDQEDDSSAVDAEEPSQQFSDNTETTAEPADPDGTASEMAFDPEELDNKAATDTDGADGESEEPTDEVSINSEDAPGSEPPEPADTDFASEPDEDQEGESIFGSDSASEPDEDQEGESIFGSDSASEPDEDQEGESIFGSDSSSPFDDDADDSDSAEPSLFETENESPDQDSIFADTTDDTEAEGDQQ